MACEDFNLNITEQLSIRTPAGPITGIPIGKNPSSLESVRALSGQVSALLAPFQAIFDIIETVLLVIQTIEAIPNAIATFSPGKITEKLEELSAKTGLLINLLPQASAIKLTADVVKLIDANLRAIRAELIDLQTLETNNNATIQLSADLFNQGEIVASQKLNVTIECQEKLISSRIDALTAGNAGVDKLVEIINGLIDLIPGNIPKIPLLGNLPSSPSEAIELIDLTLELLEPIVRVLRTV